MEYKFTVKIGYTTLAFDDKESAMRLYALVADSVPVTSVYCYGPDKAPESLKDVSYVREDGDTSIELKRVDASQFAMHLTEAEYRQKCKPQPTEVDGEARLVEPVLAISGFPSNDGDVVDADGTF